MRLLGFAAVLALLGCASAPAQTADSYAKAVAMQDPDGSLTTVAGPGTPVVVMTSTVKFPDGTVAPDERSVLMYDRPDPQAGWCQFQIGHRAHHSFAIVKENVVRQPCDGKKWARFRVAGTDIAFVGHLKKTNYKGTPVTLFEISDQNIPSSLRLTY